MQSSATRAFKLLSSKIHPQLPLTARESQQLLTLLTTSFRQHLDNEHPFNPSDDISIHVSKKGGLSKRPLKSAGPSDAKSSQTTASRHLDAVLTNPLFTVKPQRRKSGSLDVGETQQLLRDPLKWFLDQVASGSADISKASMCLEMLRSANNNHSNNAPYTTLEDKRPGTQISQWLWSSNLESSREFLQNQRLMNLLVPFLIKEGNSRTIWRWYTRKPEARMQETGLPEKTVWAFRAHLLDSMTRAIISGDGGLNAAMSTFLHAAGLSKMPGPDLYTTGISLVSHIIKLQGSFDVQPQLYDQFLKSIPTWAKLYPQLLQSLLWLHHPFGADFRPGLSFLQSPECLSMPSRHLQKRRNFIIQLSLGVAHQCLSEKSFAEAQWALEFTKDKFPEQVGLIHVQPRSQRSRQEEQQENIQLLDNLLPV